MNKLFCLFFILVLSPTLVTSRIGGMNQYKQADLQCLTHPDLFNKWSCKSSKTEKEIEVTKIDDLPPRDPEIIICGFTFGFVKSVYFDYDKSIVKPEGKAAIQRNVQYLKDHNYDRVLIEGHCDERGTAEYNLALGERRALAIKNYMIEMGIKASNILIKSWGEERPVDSGHCESSWWKNRRGDMSYIKNR